MHLHSAFKIFSRSGGGGGEGAGGKSISKLIDSWKAKKLLFQNFLSSFKTIH